MMTVRIVERRTKTAFHSFIIVTVKMESGVYSDFGAVSGKTKRISLFNKKVNLCRDLSLMLSDT